MNFLITDMVLWVHIVAKVELNELQRIAMQNKKLNNFINKYLNFFFSIIL